MSLDTETIVQIQAMMQAEPALLVQLQAETELAGAAAVIAKAAAAQGLDIAEADLMGHLETEQLRAETATLSDAELEQVAGGLLIIPNRRRGGGRGPRSRNFSE